jgi:hypothetical protein
MFLRIYRSWQRIQIGEGRETHRIRDINSTMDEMAVPDRDHSAMSADALQIFVMPFFAEERYHRP